MLTLASGSSASENDKVLRIRPDDPIWKEPEPVSVGKLVPRKIDDTYDQLEKMFFLPGKPGEGGPPRALATNTLGEVPDSAWYTNRTGAGGCRWTTCSAVPATRARLNRTAAGQY